jgi:hypothetical protein
VSTLGPRGRNAVLDKGWGAPKITKDGVTVAKEIDLDDAFENLGAQLVKEAASKTGDIAGDGTTTATLLAEAIYLEGLRMVAAGADPMALGRGIHAATDAITKSIEKMASPVNEKDKKEITQIATIAGNNDPTIGAGGDHPQPFEVDRLGKEGGGGGSVAGHIAGLRGGFLDQLGAEILERVVQIDLLGDGDAVLGDFRRAPTLVEDGISAAGA